VKARTRFRDQDFVVESNRSTSATLARISHHPRDLCRKCLVKRGHGSESILVTGLGAMAREFSRHFH